MKYVCSICIYTNLMAYCALLLAGEHSAMGYIELQFLARAGFLWIEPKPFPSERLTRMSVCAIVTRKREHFMRTVLGGGQPASNIESCQREWQRSNFFCCLEKWEPM